SSANLGVAGGSTVTIVLVAYNGANYASSNIRGHSAAFQMTAQALPATAADVGTGAWTSFAVSAVAPVPEPSTFALAGLGLAGLLIFRRRN
ncbi:MAG: motif, partial [Verrucomicrobiota bacterium]